MTINKTYHVVPPDEQPCVWMTAGIVSYQLCDRMRECDGCPLDQAIRRQFQGSRSTGSRPEQEAGQPAREKPEPLHPGLRYSRNHCWVCEGDGRLARVGIEPGLRAVLLAPKAVVFPSAGQALRAGQTCLWIVMEGGTLPLECPVNGRVTGINTELEQHAHLLHQKPFEQAWLYELGLESSLPREPHLMEIGEARRKYSADQSRLMTLLASAAHVHRSPVGATLADGGRKLQNAADMLGPARYFSILRQVFG